MKHPDLEVFVNIKFNRTGNSDANIVRKLFDSVVPKHLISQPTPVTRKHKSLFTNERSDKVSHLLTQFQVDFWSLPQSLWKHTCRLV